MKKEPEIVFFKTQKDFEKWLFKNHEREKGIWLKMFKKSSDVKSIYYPEALDIALCYGWIDGQTKRFDEKSYLQKFTPRRKRSNWSKMNTGHIERLTKLGKMKPSGILEVEKAKKDGRWKKAYASLSKMVIPEDFLVALSKDKKAKNFFKTLNKSNTNAFIWQIEDAKKEETRIRRIEKFVVMLSQGKKLY